ncbi:phage tail protein [Piscirickettsia litoralis]|uniref:Phage tail protein n=1 Tax=Piscirickettsia litoralis TaxID=1891921 RepID=A0ABX2ZYS7_9GAMM|nr:phage tail protein [Piscirickettsia litoralis]ODN41544.1 hypothetical protein BGC07_15665 [Piscirickettsia litoralis]
MTQHRMLGLGDFRFSLDTAAFQELSHKLTVNIATLKRLKKKDRAQFISAGAETLSLSGVVYPHFRGGLEQIKHMRTMAKSGKPLLLVEGTGDSLGEFFIKSVDEKNTVFSAEGVPKKKEFSLELVYCGDL